MRAIEGNGRVRTWRKLAGLVTGSALALSVIGAGSVSAATPTVDWGTFTPETQTTGAQPALVSSGRVASFTVSLRNHDTSTISQLYLKAVTQDATPVELTGLYAVSSSRNTCAQPSTNQTTLSCSFRNIKPLDVITVQVGFTVPTGTAPQCLEGQAKNFATPPTTMLGTGLFCVDFVWSSNGATTSDQNNTSHGDVWNFYDGVATTADTNVGSTYVFKSAQFTVENSGTLGIGNGQSTKAVVTETGQGVSVSDGTAIDSINCSTSTLSATDCANFNTHKFGEWSFLNVGTTGSQPAGGAFAITMSIDLSVYPLPSGVNKNNLAIYHTYTTGSGTVEEIISGACAKSNPTLPCVSSLSVSKTLVQVTFLTLHNGKGGMF